MSLYIIYELFARHLSADANALSQTNKSKLRKVTPNDEAQSQCGCVYVLVCVCMFVVVLVCVCALLVISWCLSSAA